MLTSDVSGAHNAAGLSAMVPSVVQGVCSKTPQHKGLCLERRLAVAGDSEPLVAVGTCQAFGEDYPATGRVLFFQITRKPGSGTEEEEEWDTQMIYARSNACCTGLILN